MTNPNQTRSLKSLILAKCLVVIAAFLFINPASAKEKGDYLNDLLSDDLNTVFEACNWLAEEKPEDAVDPMLNAIKNQKSSRAKIAIITALGNFEQEGAPTTGLKDIIETDKDNTVVYSALLAVLNLKDFTNPDALRAVEYCETNKQDDPFVRDITGRMRKIITG